MSEFKKKILDSLKFQKLKCHSCRNGTIEAHMEGGDWIKDYSCLECEGKGYHLIKMEIEPSALKIIAELCDLNEKKNEKLREWEKRPSLAVRPVTKYEVRPLLELDGKLLEGLNKI